MKGKRRQGAGRDPNAFIPHSATPRGIRRAHDNAARHLEDALCLYGAKRYQGTIPSAVLSLEESIKGMCFAAAHRKGGGVPASEWRMLQDHKHRLRNAKRWAEELGKDAIVAACARHIHDTTYSLHGTRQASKGDALAHFDRVSMAASGLQSLKKMATYDNWNATHGAWDTFDHLQEREQDDLAVYVLSLAVLYHDLLVHGARGALEGPCARACGFLGTMPGNPFTAASGRIVLDAMLQTGTVAQHSYHVNKYIFLKCRRVALAHGDYHNAHPFVKTMSMALTATKEPKDGHYAYYADDSAQTHDGKATMFAFLIVSKEGQLFRIEKVCINGEICDAHDSRIGAILDTELVIDRHRGPEAPLSALGEAFSQLGTAVRKLGDGEVGPALENARRMAGNGQLAHFPQDMVDSIRHATEGDWDGLDSGVRNAVAVLYVADPEVIVLSSHPDYVGKYKIRGTIWDILCSQKAIHEGKAMPWDNP